MQYWIPYKVYAGLNKNGDYLVSNSKTDFDISPLYHEIPWYLIIKYDVFSVFMYKILKKLGNLFAS